jgi:hypothetical protein
MKSLVVLSFLLFTQLSFAITSQVSIDEAVQFVENQFVKNNYKIDQESSAINLLFLKEWPEIPLLGLQLALMDEGYEVTDSDNLGALIDYVDPSGEYAVQGRIIRSLEITLSTGNLYAVVYYVFGGEWGREEDFRKFYIVDAKGQLLKSGQFY